MAQINGLNAYDSATNTTMNTQRASGMPNIGSDGAQLAVTTTNVYLYSNGMRVGFVQQFSPSETRTIDKIMELGSEGVIQSVPRNTNGGQITLQRMAVYNASLWNALGLTRTGQFVPFGSLDTSNSYTKDPTYQTFGNPFKTLKDQRVPLELQTQIRYPGATESYYIISYLDCWLTNYSKTVSAAAITITESATIFYSDVLSDFVAN